MKQAGACLAQNRGVTLDGYRRRLGTRLDKAADGIPAERTVARVWDVTLRTLAQRDPLAVNTLCTAAWLAHDDIEHSLLAPPGTDPDTLAVRDNLAAARRAARAVRHGSTPTPAVRSAPGACPNPNSGSSGSS
ncbi:hypothetical protein ACICHK_02125 [Streptomyces sp. AHU1]|uniref:hypothetical protein n=1 Tax=Streptomyces sp. AHU1 TaxID=3377215 RepID=UPI003878023C